jgi:hypothetical protein
MKRVADCTDFSAQVAMEYQEMAVGQLEPHKRHTREIIGWAFSNSNQLSADRSQQKTISDS